MHLQFHASLIKANPKPRKLVKVTLSTGECDYPIALNHTAMTPSLPMPYLVVWQLLVCCPCISAVGLPYKRLRWIPRQHIASGRVPDFLPPCESFLQKSSLMDLRQALMTCALLPLPHIEAITPATPLSFFAPFCYMGPKSQVPGRDPESFLRVYSSLPTVLLRAEHTFLFPISLSRG